MSYGVATVDVEYAVLPGRTREKRTITIDSGIVSTGTVVEALTGLHIIGCDYYCEHWVDYKLKDIPMTLAITRLRIIGSSIAIDNFRSSPMLEEVIVEASKSEVRSDCFSRCKALKSVSLSGNVSCISENAFQECSSLSTFLFPLGLRSIDRGAFYKCSALGSAILPEGLESVGETAFWRCSALSSVLFPAGLKSIGDKAFWGCSALSSALLPEGLKSIGKEAFFCCESLELATIPTTVTNMGSDVFGLYPKNAAKKLAVAVNQGARAEDPTISSLNRCDVTIVDISEPRVQKLCESRIIDESCREYATKVALESPAKARVAADKKELADAESISAYLKVVAEAETSVMQLVESLALASSIRRRLEEMRSDIEVFQKEKRRLLRNAEQSKWDAERRAISSGARLSVSETGIMPMPPEHIPEPLKPKEPMLEIPGFFNRRKIEARNAEAEREHQEALAVYEAELERVLSENYKRDMEYEEALAKWERGRDSVIRRQLSELGSKPSFGPREAEDTSGVELALEVALSAAEAMCKGLEGQLREASGLLKLAYSADIVFPKYRNIEAMTTMYEYFETGRCVSLKGPDGAYNLYEAELRSKAIIGRLDVVSDKLDVISDQLSAIQANQYTLYRAVEGIGERLDSMSGALSSILDEARATSAATRDLSAKATALVRNSAEIAYWTRKNAELTDSLGYLIAFTAL